MLNTFLGFLNINLIVFSNYYCIKCTYYLLTLFLIKYDYDNLLKNIFLKLSKVTVNYCRIIHTNGHALTLETSYLCTF